MFDTVVKVTVIHASLHPLSYGLQQRNLRLGQVQREAIGRQQLRFSTGRLRGELPPTNAMRERKECGRGTSVALKGMHSSNLRSGAGLVSSCHES